MRSVQVATRKRPVDIDKLEQMVSGIVRQLENRGDTIISSELIGTLIMEGLRQIDDVSYVRFASVYKDFREAKDFEEFLEEISDTISKFGRLIMNFNSTDIRYSNMHFR